jgi:hypothetical protein
MQIEIPLWLLMFKYESMSRIFHYSVGYNFWWWPKHVKATVYILIENLLHSMDLATYSCMNKKLRFEIFVMAKTYIVEFWVTMPCSLTGGYYV